MKKQEESRIKYSAWIVPTEKVVGTTLRKNILYFEKLKAFTDLIIGIYKVFKINPIKVRFSTGKLLESKIVIKELVLDEVAEKSSDTDILKQYEAEIHNHGELHWGLTEGKLCYSKHKDLEITLKLLSEWHKTKREKKHKQYKGLIGLIGSIFNETRDEEDQYEEILYPRIDLHLEVIPSLAEHLKEINSVFKELNYNIII